MTLPQTRKNRSHFLKDLKPLLGDDISAAEIGVFRGDYSAVIIRDLSPTYLLLVDAWRSFPQAEYTDILNNKTDKQWLELARKVKRRFSDNPAVCFRRALSVEASVKTPDGSLDFIYIDANHSYDGCLSDLKAWYPKLRDGGVMAGHDWGCPSKGKEHDLADIQANSIYPGVSRAVHDFLRGDLSPVLFTHEKAASFYFLKSPSLATLSTT